MHKLRLQSVTMMHTAEWALLISALAFGLSIWNAWQTWEVGGHTRALAFLDERAAILGQIRELQLDLSKNTQITSEILKSVPQAFRPRVQELADEYAEMERLLAHSHDEVRKMPTDIERIPLSMQFRMRTITNLHKELAMNMKTLEASLEKTLAYVEAEYGVSTKRK